MTTAQRIQLGRNVRRARLATGFSARRLGLALQVDGSYLSHLEAGRRVPSLDFLYALAGLLGCHPSELLP